MNEELQKSLVTGVLPDLVKQLVEYRIMIGFIYLGVATVVFIGFIALSIYSYTGLKAFNAREKAAHEESPALFLFFMILFSVAGLAFMISEIAELVKLNLYPLVWVLDYLKEVTE